MRTPFPLYLVTVCALGAGIVHWELQAQSVTSDTALTDRSGQPAGAWRTVGIGSAGNTGSATLDAGTLRITSGGERIDGTADSIQFVYQACTGNVAIVARMLPPTAWGNDAYAGIAIRSDVGGQAANLTLGMGSTNGLMLRRRAGAREVSRARYFRSLPSPAGGEIWELVGVRSWGAPGANGGEAVAPPLWLKLERRGRQVASYCSQDGATWQWLNTDTVDLGEAVVAGVVATRGAENLASVVEFDELTVQPLMEAAEAAPERGTGTGLRATFYNLTDTETVVTQKVFTGLEFRWPLKSLHARGLSWKNFGVVFEGEIEFPAAWPHAFHLRTLGGARLWLNGQKVIDAWDADAAGKERTYRAIVNAQAGERVPIRLEYYDDGSVTNGTPLVILKWSSPAAAEHAIPYSQLYPPGALTGDKAPLAGGRGLGTNEVAELAVSDRTEEGLEAPWLSRTLGWLGVTGSIRSLGDGVLVAAKGGKFTGADDACRFVYQPWAGDFDISVRMTDVQGGRWWDEAGLLVRANLDAGSPMVFMGKTHDNGARLTYRKSFSAKVQTPLRMSRDDKAVFVRLVRRGQMITAYTSEQGRSWNWIKTLTVDLPETVLIGAAMNTQDPRRAYEVLFDQWRLRLPDELPQLSGSGDGLLATYFGPDTNLFQRVEAQVNFDWNDAHPPVAGMEGLFSATWEGILEAWRSEPYEIELHQHNARIGRLWLDGEVVVDACDPTNFITLVKSVRVNLTAGSRHLMRVEYQKKKPGRSVIHLFWSSPTTALELIPKECFYSPANPDYASARDTDGDGMPDVWEQAYHLDPLFAGDAGLDPDGDGLANLGEYRAGTDPRKADSDGDGLPDGWEVAHGLNPLDASDADADSDHDGLTNLQEYEAGTNPTLADTDGDGIPDGEEVGELGTNPLRADITGIRVVQNIPGAAAAGRLGEWAVDGGAIIAKELRGALEYDFTVPQAGIYRLEITGSSQNSYDPNRTFLLRLTVDGTELDPVTLVDGESGHRLTPWISAGTHRLHLLWDNYRWMRSVRLEGVQVQALEGPDANGNGAPDWAEARLQKFNRVDAGQASSQTSPMCFEGLAMFRNLVQTASVTAQAGTDNRWFANVDLAANGPTDIITSFENSGLVTTNRVRWVATDVLSCGNLVIREGDAVRLTASPTNATGGQVDITITGVTNYTTTQSAPVVHRFNQAGTFSVTGTHTELGVVTSQTIQVRVVGCDLGQPLAAWAGKWRRWDMTVCPEVRLQKSQRLDLRLVQGTGAQAQYYLVESDIGNDHIVARIGTDGPVMASLPVHGFDMASGSDTYLTRVAAYDDGSELIETVIVMQPVVPEVRIEEEILAGGVLFEDGTTLLNLTAADFDALGRCKVRYVKPKSSKTSVCHQTRAYQGSVLVGEFD